MFSVAKRINGDPDHHLFLTTLVFIYEEVRRKVGVMQIAVLNREIAGAKLISCEKVHERFSEILRDLNRMMDYAEEGTRLIYKEHLESVNDVDDFAVEHLWPHVEKISVMGTHEYVAEMVRKCFPKSA